MRIEGGVMKIEKGDTFSAGCAAKIKEKQPESGDFVQYEAGQYYFSVNGRKFESVTDGHGGPFVERPGGNVVHKIEFEVMCHET